MSGSELGPWPPSVTGLVMKSFQVFTGEVFQVTQSRDIVGDAAEPGKLPGVELGAAVEQRIDAGGAGEGAEIRAVLRRRGEDIVCGFERAGARHVLRHHGRVAGDVLADVAGEMASVQIVAAADREADHHVDGLALVELLRALGVGRKRGSRQSRQAQRSESAHSALQIEVVPAVILGAAPGRCRRNRLPGAATDFTFGRNIAA